MPVTNYNTLNGELLGETGPGGRRFYGKDALGSVVATENKNGTLENTYRYKPYGGLLSKTGSAPDPRFMWTGSTGSRTTGASYAEQYNRARHYGSRQAGWTSVDPLWPHSHSYVYCGGSPVCFTDSSGLSITYGECACERCRGTIPRPVPPPFPIGPVVTDICDDIKKCAADKRCKNRATQCIRDCGWANASDMFSCYQKYCLANSENLDFMEILCGNTWQCHVFDACAIAQPGKPCRVHICTRTEVKPCDCLPSGKRWTDRCTVPKCAADDIFSLSLTILHEISHCCGVGPDGGPRGNQDLPNCIAGCMENNVR